jgi:mitochondrial fission protein ELM1
LVLSDKGGDNGQIEAVAARLPWPYETRFVAMKPKWVLRKPRVRPTLNHLDLAKSDTLEPPWPDLIITAGRRPSSVALWIQKQSGGQSRIVHLTKPSVRIDRFDLVVTSSETLLPPLPNIVGTNLPLMRVKQDPVELEKWRFKFKSLPRPLVGFLIGGPTHPYVYNRTVLDRVVSLAADIVEHQGGTPYLTTSRRTPAWFSDALQQQLPAAARLYCWSAEAKDNPYKGILGLADGLIVTGDSISMIVEAIRLGRPIGILSLPVGIVGVLDQVRRNALSWMFASREDGASPRRQTMARLLYRLGLVHQSRNFRVFHRKLVDRGQAVWAGDAFAPPAAANEEDVERVVDRIRRLMKA